MSERWDQFRRYEREWAEVGDEARLRLIDRYYGAADSRESDPERTFAMYTQSRDEAARLREPWWVFFFDAERLSTLVADLEDFGRAHPLAIELIAKINEPVCRTHESRTWVLKNVLTTFANIDPLGHQDEIERGFASLEREVDSGPSVSRHVLNFRRIEFLHDTDRFAEAYDASLKALALIEASPMASTRSWHGAWQLFLLCRICWALENPEEIAGHAEHMESLSRSRRHLRRTQADACFWIAVVDRAAGRERPAAKRLHEGLDLLPDVDRRDTICAEPMARYREVGEEWEEALAVRDRQMAEYERHGRHHGVAIVHIERCRLLSRMRRLTAADVDAARQSFARLRRPEPFAAKLERIENSP